LTDAAQEVGVNGGDVISFYGSTSVAVVHATYCTGSGTSLHCVVPAPAQNNLLMAAVQIYNSTARTASKVCIGASGNTSCSTGTQLIECDMTSNNSTCVSTGSGHAATSIWEIVAPSGSPVDMYLVPSATASDLEMAVFEVYKGSGEGSWGIDGNGAHTNNGSTSGNPYIATGPSFSTTGNPSFCLSNVGVGNQVNGVPPSGEQFGQGGALFSSGNAAVAGMFTATGSVAAKWTDAVSDTFSSSILCAK